MEARALRALAVELGSNPSGLLQKVVDTAREVCRADSAGVSILEPAAEGRVFRWRAISGAFAAHVDGTIPQEESPCGEVVARNEVMLLERPQQIPALRSIQPPVHESLLAPLLVNGTPVGTLWAISHTPDRHFDAEDARLLLSLASFAAAAWQTLMLLEAATARGTALEQRAEERSRELSAVNAQLRASEDRIQRALTIETVGVLFFALDGRMTETNRAFERMSGYSRDELRTVDWKVLTPPEFMHVTARAASELAARGETAPYEKQIIRKDGSRWWGLFAPTRISGSGPESECVEFILDITERKQAAQALQDAEARQRMALDAAELGTWKHDLAAGSVELDARARHHYGVDAPVVPIDEIIGRIHADDAPSLQRAMAEALDPAVRRPVVAEYRVLQPDGSARWLSVNGQVHFDDFDGVQRATVGIGTTRDVTEQRRAEDALRDADRRKDEFLAILSHELRNPLAPIRTAVSILRAADVPERLRLRSRDIIERQVAHMARLVDDLLDVSRLSRGKMSLQRTRVLLDEALDVAVETARPLIEERQHRLIEHRAARPVVLDADLARVAQVFANLLNNAAKYTPTGGSITIDVVEEAGHVEVRVTDTGEGLAPDQREKMFELFAQGTAGPGTGAGGLGIGLALAKGLVELHGGVLTASSPGRGGGATFAVRLPVADTSATTPGARLSEDGGIIRIDRRVLVVDDNIDAADTTAMLLQASGGDVRTAYSGEQGLREVAEFRPEVVLLDIGMPGLDGIETCQRIRARSDGDSMLIVAVTGWGQDESRRQTQLAGFDAHLVKPVAPEALLRLVENAPRRVS